RAKPPPSHRVDEAIIASGPPRPEFPGGVGAGSAEPLPPRRAGPWRARLRQGRSDPGPSAPRATGRPPPRADPDRPHLAETRRTGGDPGLVAGVAAAENPGRESARGQPVASPFR